MSCTGSRRRSQNVRSDPTNSSVVLGSSVVRRLALEPAAKKGTISSKLPITRLVRPRGRGHALIREVGIGTRLELIDAVDRAHAFPRAQMTRRARDRPRLPIGAVRPRPFVHRLCKRRRAKARSRSAVEIVARARDGLVASQGQEHHQRETENGRAATHHRDGSSG